MRLHVWRAAVWGPGGVFLAVVALLIVRAALGVDADDGLRRVVWIGVGLPATAVSGVALAALGRLNGAASSWRSAALRAHLVSIGLLLVLVAFDLPQVWQTGAGSVPLSVYSVTFFGALSAAAAGADLALPGE